MALFHADFLGEELAIFIGFTEAGYRCRGSSRFCCYQEKRKPAAIVAPEAAREAGPVLPRCSMGRSRPGPSAPYLASVLPKYGELMVIAGPTGSGKSALLQGLLGEIDLIARKKNVSRLWLPLFLNSHGQSGH